MLEALGHGDKQSREGAVPALHPPGQALSPLPETWGRQHCVSRPSRRWTPLLCVPAALRSPFFQKEQLPLPAWSRSQCPCPPEPDSTMWLGERGRTGARPRDGVPAVHAGRKQGGRQVPEERRGRGRGVGTRETRRRGCGPGHLGQTGCTEQPGGQAGQSGGPGRGSVVGRDREARRERGNPLPGLGQHGRSGFVLGGRAGPGGRHILRGSGLAVATSCVRQGVRGPGPLPANMVDGRPISAQGAQRGCRGLDGGREAGLGDPQFLASRSPSLAQVLLAFTPRVTAEPWSA